MISLDLVLQFLLSKGWTVGTQDDFGKKLTPPSELGFSSGFFIYLPLSLDKLDDKNPILHDTLELIHSIYDLDPQELKPLLSNQNDILSVRVFDTENKDGSISLGKFEYLISKLHQLLLKSAGFVIKGDHKMEEIPVEANKYLKGCKFLQTDIGSFITRISLPTEDVIKPRTLFEEEIKGKIINLKVYEMFDFVHNNFFSSENIDQDTNFNDLVTQNATLISVDVLKEIKLLYQESGIKNIEYSYMTQNFDTRKSTPTSLSKKNIEYLDKFIDVIEDDLKSDVIESYGKVVNLHAADRQQDGVSRKVTLSGTQFGDTVDVVVNISKEQYVKAIKAHEKCSLVRIKGRVEKLKTQVNVVDIEELEFVGIED